MQNQEKRRTGRLALSVAIEAFSGSFPIGVLRNLGPEGMFIQSTEPKEVGTQMDLSLTLPKGHRKILLTGEVTWVNYPPSQQNSSSADAERRIADNPGMGLRILSIKPEDRALLQQLMMDSEADVDA
jgi:uncharacterized protein (TIGR02266 family)